MMRKASGILLKYFYQKKAMKCFWAENVNAAMRISDEQDLDLIISDIIIPKSTGIDLLSAIKSKKS